MNIPELRLQNFLDNVVRPLGEYAAPTVDGTGEAVRRLLSEATEWVELGNTVGYFASSNSDVGQSMGRDTDVLRFGRDLEDAWIGLDYAQITSLALVHFASDAGWRAAANRARESIRSAPRGPTVYAELAWIFSVHDGKPSEPSGWRVTYSDRSKLRLLEVSDLRSEAATGLSDVQHPASDVNTLSPRGSVGTPSIVDIRDYLRDLPADESLTPHEGTVTVEQAQWFSEVFGRLLDALVSAIPGHDDVAEWMLIALLSEQHILIDFEMNDAPRELVRSLADLISGTSSLIRAAGLRPREITGDFISDRHSKSVSFHHGPIFSSITMLEGISRARRSTRDAVFQIMEEGSVLLEGVRYSLGSPFLLVGAVASTEPKLSAVERSNFGISKRQPSLPLAETMETMRAAEMGSSTISPLITTTVISDIQVLARGVHVGAHEIGLIARIFEAVEKSVELSGLLGFSAARSLASVSKVVAFANARPYVSTDDIVRSVLPVLEHRVERTSDAVRSGRTVEWALKTAVQAAMVANRGSRSGGSASI